LAGDLVVTAEAATDTLEGGEEEEVTNTVDVGIREEREMEVEKREVDRKDDERLRVAEFSLSLKSGTLMEYVRYIHGYRCTRYCAR
jgi:hypothetical protein